MSDVIFASVDDAPIETLEDYGLDLAEVYATLSDLREMIGNPGFTNVKNAGSRSVNLGKYDKLDIPDKEVDAGMKPTFSQSSSGDSDNQNNSTDNDSAGGGSGSQSGDQNDKQNGGQGGSQGDDSNGNQNGGQGGSQGADSNGNQNGDQGGSQSDDSNGNQNGGQGGSQSDDSNGNQNGGQGGDPNWTDIGGESATKGEVVRITRGPEGGQDGSPSGSQGGSQGGSQSGSQSGRQDGGQDGNQNGSQDGNQSGGQDGNQNGGQDGNQNGSQNGGQNGDNTSGNGQLGSDLSELLNQMVDSIEDEIKERQKLIDEVDMRIKGKTGSASFGDDDGGTAGDFEKKLKPLDDVRKLGKPSHGKGIGTGTRVVKLGDWEMNLDDYNKSIHSDIIAQSENGEDVNTSKSGRAAAERLAKETSRGIATIAAEKGVLEKMKKEEELRQDPALRHANDVQANIDAMFNSQGVVDWRDWLRKRLASHFESMDFSYFGHEEDGGTQAAYGANGFFFAADEKERVKNRARVELFFDTSGSIGSDELALFFREVAQIMTECHAQVMKTTNNRKQWNDLIKLYIYCWDGGVLCNAPVRSAEELVVVARGCKGGGGTDPNCIFQFKEYNDGLRPLPMPKKGVERGGTGVPYLDSMSDEQFLEYVEDRTARLGKGLGNPRKALKDTITIVFTDYGFGDVKTSWITKHPEWSAVYNVRDKNQLMWVCSPNKWLRYDEARKLTPFGDICIMPELSSGSSGRSGFAGSRGL